jgi:hypothetical protein
LHGDSASLTGLKLTSLGRTRLRSQGAQNPPTTPNRHAFRQSDFGGHGESQLHDRPFRQRRLGIKKYSSAAQVLSKSVHSPAIELNR